MVDGNEDFKLQASEISNQDIEEAFVDFLHAHYTPEQILDINETFSYDPEKRTMTWRDGDDIVQIKGDETGRLKEFRAIDVEQTDGNTQVQQLSMQNYGQKIKIDNKTGDDDNNRQHLKYQLKSDGKNYTEIMKEITSGSRTLKIPTVGLDYTEKYRHTESSRTKLNNNYFTVKERSTTSYSGALGAGIDTSGHSLRLNTADGSSKERNFSAGAYVDDVMGVNGGAYYNSNTTNKDGEHTVNTTRNYRINTSAGLENGADINLQYQRTVTDNMGNQTAHAGFGLQADYYTGPLYSSAGASLNLESGQQHLSASAGISNDLIMGSGVHSSLDIGNSDTYFKLNEAARAGSLAGSKNSFGLSAQIDPISLDIKSANSANFISQKSSQGVKLQAGSAKTGISQNSSGNLLGSTSETNAYATAGNVGVNFTNHNEANVITSGSATTLNLDNGGNSTQLYYKTDELTGNIEIGREIQKESVDEDKITTETSTATRASIGIGGITGVNYGIAVETESSAQKSDENGMVVEGMTNRKTAGIKPVPDLDNNTHYIRGGIGYKNESAQVTLNENTGQYAIKTEKSLAGITTAGRVQKEQTSTTIHRDVIRAKEQMQSGNIQTKLDQYIEAYTQNKAGVEKQIDNFQTRPQRMLSNVIRAQHLDNSGR